MESRTPCHNPQATKVPAAPCHNPIRVIVVRLAASCMTLRCRLLAATSKLRLRGWNRYSRNQRERVMCQRPQKSAILPAREGWGEVFGEQKTNGQGGEGAGRLCAAA